MTTICYDGKSLCTDSQATLDNIKVADGHKIYTLNDGRICAMCGDADVIPEILDWLNGGVKPEVKDDDNFGGIVVDPDTGDAKVFNESFRLWNPTIPWAGGSGCVVAYTALKFGCSASDAIAAACELDIYSSLPIQEVKIKGKNMKTKGKGKKPPKKC